MDYFSRDLFDTSLVGLICFLAVFGCFLWAFARSEAGRLVLGFLRLVLSVITAPVRYLDACVARIVDHCKTGGGSHKVDRQFLLQRILLISNAWILLTSCAILASGLLGAWNTVYPLGLRLQRKTAEAAISETNQRIGGMDKEVAELSGKLGGETEADRKIKELTDRQAALRSRLTSEGQTLDQAAQAEWRDVVQYLGRFDKGISDFESRSAVQNVVNFVERSRLDLGSKQRIIGYARSWGESKAAANQLKEEERNNPRVRITQRKIEIENDIRQSKQNVMRWTQETSVSALWKQLQFGQGVLVLIRALLGCALFVWIAGLVIELAGLAVDVAQNVRLAREAVESPKRAHDAQIAQAVAP